MSQGWCHLQSIDQKSDKAWKPGSPGSLSKDQPGWQASIHPSYLMSLQLASMPFIILYDPTHSPSLLSPQRLELIRHLRIPVTLSDPSPAAFMVACLAYAFAVGTYLNLHQGDCHPRRFLIIAVLIASLLSFLEYGTLKNWLPVTISTALVARFIDSSSSPNSGVQDSPESLGKSTVQSSPNEKPDIIEA